MIYVLCVSMSENMESEMRYNPVCFSIKKSSHEHKLVNLNDSSTVSNETEITISIPTIFFTADRKSLNYHGQTFIFNCPMPKKEHDFITQMVHWVENDKTTSLVNGKEYISCQNEQKIYIFSVETPLAKNSNTIKNYVLYVFAGVAGLSVAATLGEALYKYMTTDRRPEIERQAGGMDAGFISRAEMESRLLGDELDSTISSITLSGYSVEPESFYVGENIRQDISNCI